MSPRGARAAARGREGGFSFVEILVVMGIIAVLVSLGVVTYNLVFQKTPQITTKASCQKFAAKFEAFKNKVGAYPPTELKSIGVVTGMPYTVTNPPNLTNAGIESAYLCLKLPGWGQGPDARDDEIGNVDEDRLDKPVAPTIPPELFELLDAWGNPFVYFASADYAAMEKNPPTYLCGAPDAQEQQVQPKPWRSTKTGEFEQQRKFQLFSMGPDSTPNTDDDIKAWE